MKTYHRSSCNVTFQPIHACVQKKSHRRVLMMLRGGTAPFQIETTDGKVYSEKSVCV